MKPTLPLVIAATMAASGPAIAADCGEPPMDGPTVPDGSQSDSEQIRQARDKVLGFSKQVDAYLTCMDQRAPTIMPYLTKEQQTRWDEDLAKVHDYRRELQVKLNEAIRAYRRSRNG